MQYKLIDIHRDIYLINIIKSYNKTQANCKINEKLIKTKLYLKLSKSSATYSRNDHVFRANIHSKRFQYIHADTLRYGNFSFNSTITKGLYVCS